MSDFNVKLKQVLSEIEETLLKKNAIYGDATTYQSVFSTLPNIERLKISIDDKISRLKNQQPDEDEDVIQDILGYLILLRIAQQTK